MSDEANDTTTHLSDAEMQDLVVACVPAHDSEALYLITRLEDAGIPAAQINAGFRYPGTSPDLRVPRVLLNKAQETIAKARKDAQDRSMENASDSTKDANDNSSDPILAEMQELNALPIEEKRCHLIFRTIDWFASGRNDEDIAQYLSVAGLTPEEIQDLVREIHAQHQKQMRKSLSQHRHMSIALLLFGALTLVVAILVLNSHHIALMSGFLLIALGLVVLYGATRTSSQSTPNPENDQK